MRTKGGDGWTDRQKDFERFNGANWLIMRFKR